MEDGDVPWRRGTARAAFRNRDFTIFWSGMFASNIGTWMQTLVLAEYGLKIGGPAYVGYLGFAVLGPLLLLAPVAGLIADVVDRRRWLITNQTAMLVCAFVLAAYVWRVGHVSTLVIFLLVFLNGVFNALTGPGMSAISPTLVPPEDLNGAVSLFSFQMNMSRVVGPLIGTAIYNVKGPGLVFAVNAVTYLFAVAGLVFARYPRRAGAVLEERGFARLASGFRIAWHDQLVRRVLIILWTMSLVSLNFIQFMSVHAQQDLAIPAKSLAFGMLYASFALGAAAGAVSVGTIFSSVDQARIVRPSLIAFAVFLGLFGALHGPAPAYPVVFLLGYAYFAAITALSTVLQANIANEVRGRLSSLWIMGFGGAVGIAALLWAPLADYSVVALLEVGAVWAVVLVWVASPRSLRRSEEIANA
ncbi:MAG TPA: MFS transporter [Acidimicrobiia bacterium]